MSVTTMMLQKLHWTIPHKQVQRCELKRSHETVNYRYIYLHGTEYIIYIKSTKTLEKIQRERERAGSEAHWTNTKKI